MNAYRITLADDHALLRQGLRRIIEESDEMTVVGEASDGLELLNLLNSTVPDMVVIDISMPNLPGIEAIAEIKSRYPHVKIMVLTMHKNLAYLKQAFSSGADAYLLKEESDTELFSAISEIRQGRTFISPSLSHELAVSNSQTNRPDEKTSLNIDNLTTYERKILRLIAEGKTSREIAELFVISVSTVNRHRANIMDKLYLRSPSALVHYAITHGI